ncbi:MAG TPA: alpha/beta hydrolase [Actinopolymorphaceae bacterium]
MHTVTSADGTTIAYERAGSGPTIVFLSGAFNDRTTCAPVAEHLRDRWTTVLVDRRGRGDSTDAIAAADVGTYDVRREIEDLDAVIAAEGGDAVVFGFSSGAHLALHAAAAGSRITRLALYEPPFAIGGLAGTAREGLVEKLAALVADGKNGDAVATMQLEGIGLPAEMVEQARRSPMWAGLEAMAQTVVYDAALTRAPNVPTPQMARLEVPTLVLAGAESWPMLRDASRALAQQLARAEYVEVAGGSGHGMPAESTADAVTEFLGR